MSITWGLIGASTIAREWMVPAINVQPDSHVAAVMSTSAERGAAFASANGIDAAYDSVDSLLAHPGLDAIYISTTNERHKAELLASVAAGKHVLCEKPLALNLEDAGEMVSACKAAGLVMGTNHHLRNAVAHKTLRRLVQEGAIGRPLAARVFHAVHLPPHLQTWRIKDPATGAGVILDITVHDTDTLRFILDDEVEEVTALSAQQGMASGDLEDAVMGVMRFKSGLIAQFHDAFTIAHAGTGIEIHGTDGTLRGRDVMTQQPIGTITLSKDGVDTVVELGPPGNLYENSVAAFNAAVQGSGAPAATGEDGVRSLAVGLAVAESAATGQAVQVRYL